MRHEAALKRIDELDAGQEPGLALRFHLSRCPACASEARLLKAALSAYRAEEGEPRARETSYMESRVMAALRLMPSPRQDFAIRDWLFPGAVMLLSMCLLPLGANLGFLEPLFGQGFALSLSLVLGLLFIAYSALFVATHMDELQSQLRKRGLLPR